MDLQELISRGRFVFAGSPERLKVYKLVDGRKSAKDLARRTRRRVNNIHRDLRRLADVGLIEEKEDREGKPIKIEGFTIYTKTPLARAVPISYFSGPVKLPRGAPSRKVAAKNKARRVQQLPLPTETEILDICRGGEDQTYEFKAVGTDVRKISREIAAMLNTRQGGIIFYGVEDDGTIQGSDMPRQRLDQALQNSVKNSISPAATVTLKSVSVMGSGIVLILVPPWNRRDVYQFDERVLIRKGTNVFAAKPEELKRLHRGEYVV